jgi:hypothetical protein
MAARVLCESLGTVKKYAETDFWASYKTPAAPYPGETEGRSDYRRVAGVRRAGLARKLEKWISPDRFNLLQGKSRKPSSERSR